MAAMGIAVYSALDTIEITEGKEKENSSIISQPTEPPVSSYEEPTDDQSEIINTEETPVDNQTKTEYFTFPLDGEVVKEYDESRLQYSSTYNDLRLHTGMDIKPVGSTDVLCASAGTVKAVEENTTLGTVITVEHSDGIIIKYCGVKNVTVKANDSVLAGDILGEVGTVNNECSDGEHIHIEVYKDSKPIDPKGIFAYN